MSKFVVAPHFRLQEWVAEEKGYFAAESLDYEFRACGLYGRAPASSDPSVGISMLVYIGVSSITAF
jgi:hypothetical protein